MRAARAIFNLLILALLVWLAWHLYQSESGKKEPGSEKSAEESRVTRPTEGTPVIRFNAEEREKAGLVVEKLHAASLKPEASGFARVLDPAPLATLVNELEAAQSAADSSQQELKRLKILESQNNTSAREVQAGETAAKRDQIQLEAVRLKITSTFGQTIASRDDLSAFAKRLLSQESALVRVDTPAGDAPAQAPSTARLFAPANSGSPAVAQFISAAPTVDAQTQSPAYLFLVSSNGQRLLPGSALNAIIEFPGEAQAGEIVPDEAVVRTDGKAWIYLQNADGSFTRWQVPLTHPRDGGWFVVKGFFKSDLIVTRGAQMLLSEELKGAGGAAD